MLRREFLSALAIALAAPLAAVKSRVPADAPAYDGPFRVYPLDPKLAKAAQSYERMLNWLFHQEPVHAVIESEYRRACRAWAFERKHIELDGAKLRAAIEGVLGEST